MIKGIKDIKGHQLAHILPSQFPHDWVSYGTNWSPRSVQSLRHFLAACPLPVAPADALTASYWVGGPGHRRNRWEFKLWMISTISYSWIMVSSWGYILYIYIYYVHMFLNRMDGRRCTSWTSIRGPVRTCHEACLEEPQNPVDQLICQLRREPGRKTSENPNGCFSLFGSLPSFWFYFIFLFKLSYDTDGWMMLNETKGTSCRWFWQKFGPIVWHWIDLEEC